MHLLERSKESNFIFVDSLRIKAQQKHMDLAFGYARVVGSIVERISDEIEGTKSGFKEIKRGYTETEQLLENEAAGIKRLAINLHIIEFESKESNEYRLGANLYRTVQDVKERVSQNEAYQVASKLYSGTKDTLERLVR